MKTKLSKLFSVAVILALLLPMAAFGQTPSIPVADIGIQNGPPPGFDPSKLQLDENQPVITGEFSGGKDPLTYVVILDDPAVASYTGGISGFSATSPSVTGVDQLDAEAPEALAYSDFLNAKQVQAIDVIEQQIGRAVDVRHQYTFALNGMSLKLTPAEAAQVATLPGVADVQVDTAFNVTTDTSPEWLGAVDIWDGSGTGGLPGTMGEGIVVGILDTGINFNHPSFAEVGGDGYVHQNPWAPGVYTGWCNPSHPNYDASYTCNDKLIGAWDYADASWPGESDGPFDHHSHGSHTASTTAGNIITSTLDAPTAAVTKTLSGMAPHANIIMYDVCGDSCYTTDLVAAINQAIIDGVDVINESIGIGGDSFTGMKQAAYLNAVSAGIFVARSAGNSGPGASTVGPEPVWTLTTANLKHDRVIENSLINMDGGSTPPADISGLGFTSGYGPAEIVYAGDYTSTLTTTPNLCGAGAAESWTSPWPAGTFNGEIVVCDRGTYGRVEKGDNVLAAGAGGYILADHGGGLVADAHSLPAVHISYADGDILKSWLISTTVQTATISGYSWDYIAESGDIMAGSSSRGPGPVNVIKPDGGAPGTSIWAAYRTDDETGFMSGTSMASPHVAGAAALIKAVHPTWTPSQIKSALMTTATTANTFKEDGVTPTDPFDVGGGRIQIPAAAQAGLLFDETIANYSAANAANADELNLPSFANGACYKECSWTRTVESSMAVAETWTATVDAPAGVELMVEPSSFTLDAGGTQTFTVTATVTEAAAEDWAFGSVTFSPSGGTVPDAYLPLAAYVSASTDANTITKAVDDTDAIPGGVMTYTISVANTAAATQTFTVTDVVPMYSEYISGTASGGFVYDDATDSLNWSGELGPTAIEITDFTGSGYGYLSLAGLGVSPIPPPSSNPDDGCYGIGGLNTYYMGEHYTNGIWSVNGGIELGQASGGYCLAGGNTALPSTGVINNTIAPWWTDLDMSSAGNWYWATLTAGSNSFEVFEWEDVPRYGDPASTATFQLWLLNGTDLIWFAYDHLDGVDGTIGAEDSTGTLGDMLYHDGAGTKPVQDGEWRVASVTSTPAVLEYSVKVTGVPDDYVFNEAFVTGDIGSDNAAFVNTLIGDWPYELFLPLIFK